MAIGTKAKTIATGATTTYSRNINIIVNNNNHFEGLISFPSLNRKKMYENQKKIFRSGFHLYNSNHQNINPFPLFLFLHNSLIFRTGYCLQDQKSSDTRFEGINIFDKKP